MTCYESDTRGPQRGAGAHLREGKNTQRNQHDTHELARNERPLVSTIQKERITVDVKQRDP